MSNIVLQARLRKWAELGLNKAFEDANVESTSQLLTYIADQINEQDESSFKIPIKANGKPWLIGDMCLTNDGQKGTVAGFNGEDGINVLFEDKNGHEWCEWYMLYELNQDYIQEVINEITIACEDDSTYVSEAEFKYWIKLLRKAKED